MVRSRKKRARSSRLNIDGEKKEIGVLKIGRKKEKEGNENVENKVLHANHPRISYDVYRIGS